MMSKRKSRRLPLIAVTLAIMTGSVQAGQQVSTSCRKRLSDGDIIASDTRKLPELNSGFKVLRFKPNRTRDGWSYGPCILETLSAKNHRAEASTGTTKNKLGAVHPGVGFIFDGAQVTNAGKPSQALRVWEKISLNELKRRFPGYAIQKIKEDCGGDCFLVSGNAGSFQVDSGGEGTSKFYRIFSEAASSHDSLGTKIGMPLALAAGSISVECDEGDETVCASKKIRGLSYVTGGCPVNRGSGSGEYKIPPCATVAGFEISRTKGGQ